MKDWATSEPEAALAWFLEKRAAGDLDPGLSGELHGNILGDLLLGLASSNPAKSLEFYRELPREEIRTHFPRWMASACAKEMMASGDDTTASARMIASCLSPRTPGCRISTRWSVATRVTLPTLGLRRSIHPIPWSSGNGGMFKVSPGFTKSSTSTQTATSTATIHNRGNRLHTGCQTPTPPGLPARGSALTKKGFISYHG